MPTEGTYEIRKITQSQFVETLKRNKDEIDSSIGYQATAQYIKEISGVDVPINREMTTLKDGDRMLIIKLKYRVKNPKDKGKFKPNSKDFEYFACWYYT